MKFKSSKWRNKPDSPAYEKELQERLKNNVKKITKNGCWLWGRACDTNGYGRMSMYGELAAAHRVSYLVFIGNIPRGMYVCHKCDVRNCINPDHLFIGTAKENTLDCLNKGRSGAVSNGERHFNSKLTEKSVIEILELCSLKKLNQHEIAALYNVNHATISAIHTGAKWKYLQRSHTE